MSRHRTLQGSLDERRPKGYQPMFAFHERAAAIDAVIGDRSVVYAIRLADGVVKIGCTSNFRRRRRDFGAATKLLAFQFGDAADEREIHRRLRQHLARGREYYHPAAEVIAVVNEMREKWNLPPIADQAVDERGTE